MSKQPPRPRPRPTPKAAERPHDPAVCGFDFDSSCDECRKEMWADKVFSERAAARPFGPALPRPRINPHELIQTLHHWRTRSAMKSAILDLILPELVEIILDLQERKSRS